MRKKKVVKYVAPPLPDLTGEETAALEKRLRAQIDSWAQFQSDHSERSEKGFLDRLLHPHRAKKYS